MLTFYHLFIVQQNKSNPQQNEIIVNSEFHVYIYPILDPGVYTEFT